MRYISGKGKASDVCKPFFTSLYVGITPNPSSINS